MNTVFLLPFIVTLQLVSSGPSWDGLRVTFGVNPFSKWDFASMPRDLSGDTQGFVLKDDFCSTPGGLFVGQRYWYENDPATILIFDKNGFIAGIQTSAPKSEWTPEPGLIGNYVLDEGDSYTLTVYFVDPNIVCTGRSADEFADQGTGTDLYVQTGPDPLNNVFQVPNNEADIKKTLWGYGKCFWTMGMHYWYNVTLDMPCNNFVPYCLLYNNGVLNAFCFALNGNLASERYEHPTAKQAAGFLDPVPNCFNNDPMYAKLSTLHVYTTSNYLADRC